MRLWRRKETFSNPDSELEQVLTKLREVNSDMNRRALQLFLQARALEQENSNGGGEYGGGGQDA